MDLEDKEIVITHETLFEILKREKDRTELQKLDRTFYTDVVSYLNEKAKAMEGDDELFSAEDKKKTERQADNARRIIRDIFEKREKKVIGMALDKSRTKSYAIDTSAMLPEEKEIYGALVSMLDAAREGILNRVLEQKAPLLSLSAGFNHWSKEESQKNMEEKRKAEEKARESSGTKMVRFVNAVPKFVGEELEEYGPFDEEDVANLPAAVADVLINKGRAEELRGG